MSDIKPRRQHTISHLIRPSDMNHHGTLFAGQMAAWFVEAAFVSAASLYGRPENIVCRTIHGLTFGEPVERGDIITITAGPVLAGKTSITVYAKVTKESRPDTIYVDGFITFVCVDKSGRKMPHHLTLEAPKTDDEKSIASQAKALKTT